MKKCKQVVISVKTIKSDYSVYMQKTQLSVGKMDNQNFLQASNELEDTNNMEPGISQAQSATNAEI